jgi:hypothetical protein
VVVGAGARLILLGLVIGAPGIWFAGQVIRGTLVGISPFDPLTSRLEPLARVGGRRHGATLVT